jgi:hypothetical protein
MLIERPLPHFKTAQENVAFKWFERLLGVLSIISMTMVIVFAITSTVWNIHTPRYPRN